MIVEIVRCVTCRLRARVAAVRRWQDILRRLRGVRDSANSDPLHGAGGAAHDPHDAHVRRAAGQ